MTALGCTYDVGNYAMLIYLAMFKKIIISTHVICYLKKEKLIKQQDFIFNQREKLSFTTLIDSFKKCIFLTQIWFGKIN